MSLSPRLLLGHVRHRRLRPVTNAFIYPVFFIQLPLSDLGLARSSVFSVDRFNLLSFLQKDHGPRDGRPLLPWIRNQLRERGLPDDGEVILQTFPRVLGYVFNPISFWYCHDRDGQLIAVLAEVNNTFGGTHGYLLHHPDGAPMRDGQIWREQKRLHVSPFCEVQGSYRFRFYRLAENMLVRIDYDDEQGELLLTSISGKSAPWTNAALIGAFVRMPWLTVMVMVRIHWQALKLWAKRVPFFGRAPAHTNALKENAE